MQEEIYIKFSGRAIKLNVRRTNSFTEFTGLMFKNRNTENLLFEFGKNVRIGIHSFFVFFEFLAVWMDENNNVLEYKIVRPFSPLIRPRKHFRKFAEIPLNGKNKKIIKYFSKLRNSTRL